VTPALLTPPLLYALAGAGLVALGLRAVVARPHLFWKILGLNVLANGVFLVLVGATTAGGAADPVPQAMILTGIVVAVSATALALGLALRVKAQTGSPHLPEEEDG
jgi:multicomponent Na+:H+ antiporter subunit C